MLREGWDVPEVGVILLLRKFGSRVYGQQVIGRGLRRIRTGGVDENEQQICAVVDHPKLEHQWLWEIFSSKVRTDVGVDDDFDENEDLPEPPPRQTVCNPENFIEIPEPSENDDEEFCIDISGPPKEPLKNWWEILNGLNYPSETVTITDQNISGVERRELIGFGWTTLQSTPDYETEADIALTSEELKDAIKSEILNVAERLLEHVGHTSQYKGRIYAILIEHVRAKFLDGASLGLAQRIHLETTWRTLPKVEASVKLISGLVEGMVKHGDK